MHPAIIPANPYLKHGFSNGDLQVLRRKPIKKHAIMRAFFTSTGYLAIQPQNKQPDRRRGKANKAYLAILQLQ
ncbi:MAG TPA: hypothetical protein DGR15_01925 [Methylophilus sp.]|nr:hypothetical protein [Methylophilus sp.]